MEWFYEPPGDKNYCQRNENALSNLFHLYTLISLGLQALKQISYVYLNPVEFRETFLPEFGLQHKVPCSSDKSLISKMKRSRSLSQSSVTHAHLPIECLQCLELRLRIQRTCSFRVFRFFEYMFFVFNFSGFQIYFYIFGIISHTIMCQTCDAMLGRSQCCYLQNCPSLEDSQQFTLHG